MLCFVVGLIFVYFLAGLALLVIYLLLFRGSEFSSVGLSVGVDLLVDMLLVLFDVCRFARRHLTGFHAVGNASL